MSKNRPNSNLKRIIAKSYKRADLSATEIMVIVSVDFTRRFPLNCAHETEQESSLITRVAFNREGEKGEECLPGVRRPRDQRGNQS